MAYTLQFAKQDTLAVELAASATSFTLTTGNFGSPSGAQLYVIDYDVPAKSEIISASVASTAGTGVTRGLTGGAAGTTVHSIGAKIGAIFTPQHYAALVDGTGLSLSAGIVPGAAIANAGITSTKLAPTAGQVVCSVNTTVNSASDTDITGATLAITPTVSSKLLVWATFDIGSGALNDVYVGYLDVDGVNQTRSAILEATSATDRKTVHQSWVVSLTAAAHTVKLQGARASGAGSATYNANHTGFTYMLIAA